MKKPFCHLAKITSSTLAILSLMSVLGLSAAAHAHAGHDHHAPPATEANTTPSSEDSSQVPANPGEVYPFAGHLSFDGGQLHAHLYWEVLPEVGVEAIMIVEFFEGAAHTPVEINAEPLLVIDMPQMNHGSAPTKTTPVAGASTGTYRITNIHFIMAGQWRVALSLESEDGDVETQYFNIDIAGDSDADHGHGHGHGHQHHH